MTFLMVNLNDLGDCREAIGRLKDAIAQMDDPPGGHGPGRRRRGVQEDGPRHEGPREEGARQEKPREEGPGGEHFGPPRRGPGRRGEGRGPSIEELHGLPLLKKLRRISQRGVFKHLSKIATHINAPMSLPEMDRHLALPANKMRSLKAIMAKLENRFGLRFLVVEPAGGLDDNGNPRYVMPLRMRNQIRNIAAENETV